MKNRSSESNRDSEMADSGAYRRQLQQLFHLHDSGLDQSFIYALPVFLYKEIVGLKEPLDCAVCLCDHGFHVSCIDTWLLSNSTCPPCRGLLFSPGSYECGGGIGVSKHGTVVGISVSAGPKPHEDLDSTISSRRVFSRNGSSNSNLDSRSCFSMGSFQYVVADSELQVALCPNGAKNHGVDGGGGQLRGIVKGKSGHNGNSTNDGDNYGKRINIGNRG
ncbi:unnamed protein product [Withania somnifera]